ncbi:TPA: polysaccharide biosynthesis C-terminal domain-containing protein [Candidatus Ventrenecus stercoripullorum]|nr:polysaccharide biosynthesis C-terminal domain-containing protein [Candidatus Ventrenecus stercoripullorum]
MKNNITLLNTITSILLQIITIISGFVIPRLILKTFGSDVNGLVSSLNQFLNYIALIEGGITGVVMASLYKPLYKKDIERVSSIVQTTKKFYKKIALFFVAYTVILAIVYPLIFDTGFSFGYVSTLTIILSIKLFLQYMFSLSLKTLLNADKKVYIVSITQIALVIVDMLLFAIIIQFWKSIHVLKLISAGVYILQPVIFNYFVNKYFALDEKAEENKELLKNRWNGFAINIAAFIHGNTDVAVLTYFANLATVSVYSVYSLVTTGLKSIISAISTGITPSLGHLYAKGDMKELNEKFDLIEYMYFLIVFFFFSVGTVCITPFVLVYTKGIVDANYNQYLFGIILLLAEGIFTIRGPYVNLAYAANKFKEIRLCAYIEAFLNIVISIILVRSFGLIGVAIGTLISMMFRTFYQVWFLKKHILNRPLIKFIKKVLLFGLTAILGFIICVAVTNPIFAINNVYSWTLGACVTSFIYGILYISLCILMYKNETRYYFDYFKTILKRK